LPQAEIEDIDSLLQQVSAIDADIQQLSANKPSWSVFDNRFVHVLLLVPCFPIGLFFIWRSGQWSRRAKLLWTGGAMAVVVIWAALVLSVPESQESRAIADGDRLWEAGEKDAAVEKYLVVVNDWMPLGVKDDLPRVYARVIDYAATNDDKTLATIVIEKAFKDRLTLQLHESKAKQWSAELVSTLRAKKEEEEKGERPESIESPNSHKEVPLVRLLQVRPGMSEQSVKAILGDPHEVDEKMVKGVSGLGSPSRSLLTWTYNPNSDKYIVLLFEHGRLQDGGSGGYNIKKGLTVQPELNRIIDGQ